MLLTTTDRVEGKECDIIGLVTGTTVQSKHLGKDILSGFKTLVGGEVTAYREMLEEARKIAMERMQEEARKLDADAILAVRFASASTMQGAAEITCYGTAVKFK